jgi:DNA-binding transcriptional LysR family regulator
MELRQLRYFVTVAEEASFTKAAAKLLVAQSGVSAQVRRLERELGQELLDRSTRTVRLTEVGAAVLPYARAALEAAAGVRLAVDELTGLVHGHVTMGMLASASPREVDVPGLLADFHRAHPGVEITLSEGRSDQLVEALQAGELDVAIAGFTGITPPGIATQDIVDEPLVAAVAHGDPLAARSAIPLTALRERTLVSLPWGTGVRAILDDAAAAVGFRPRVAFEASDPRLLVQLASRGLGVAILPESAATAAEELHAIRITRPQLHGRVALAWRAEGPIGPAARALIGHARAALADARPPRAAPPAPACGPAGPARATRSAGRARA